MYQVDYLWTEDEPQPYEIDNLFAEDTLTFVIVSSNIDQTLSNYIKYMDPWIKQYPWNYKQPDCQARVTNSIEYIYGEFQYHEHKLDMELFIALLLNFTKYDHNSFIHVFDSGEIEPVLVLCHDCLPAHLLSVTNGRNKAWLHRDSIVVVNDHIADGQERYLSLDRAVRQLFNGDFSENAEMAQVVKRHCSLGVGLSHAHDLVLKLPRTAAKVVAHDPMMIARSLATLEDMESIQPVSSEAAAAAAAAGDDVVEVNVVVNAMNLGVLLRLAGEFDGELNEGGGDRQELISGLVIAGLQHYYAGKPEPKVPETLVASSRHVLQDELIARGIIDGRIEEDHEVVNVISGVGGMPGTQEDEEAYARKLQTLLEQGYDDMGGVLDDEEEEEENDDEDEDGVIPSDLQEFRWKYYDMTSTWLSEEELKPTYERIRALMMESNVNFHSDFKGTEFEDFPEFMESDIILDMASQPHCEGNHNDNGGDHDDAGVYQGDMAYKDYVKFKKELRKDGSGANLHENDDDDDDDDWEDVDNDDDDDDDDESSQDGDELVEVYDEKQPQLEPLHDLVDSHEHPRLSKEEIERLTKDLQQMRTTDNKNLESLLQKQRKI
ncbi:uncharacterized protein LODBEIA_P43670 [Lodderomyces beijingensis]|uniref:Uncharacterized protein n=1 Tax=Lodderomyces beijingensis TaxID=1775926 RepID=A0ABP0ZR34_9ASCO